MLFVGRKKNLPDNERAVLTGGLGISSIPAPLSYNLYSSAKTGFSVSVVFMFLD